MKITQLQIDAACDMSQKVFQGKITATEAADILVIEHGLNKATASDFIRDYKCLAEGRVFHRAMSASAMRHFMNNIFSEHDEKTKINSVTALKLHISYYENHYKTIMHAMRSVADEFTMRIQVQRTALELAADFELAIQNSLRSNRTDRLKRLAIAEKIPASITVTTRVFVRNPDVVAETLVRANGKCEECFSDAPFFRRKDGSPYLEVHHRVQLAAGGDDSVENSVALCPNCHRRSHYG